MERDVFDNKKEWFGMEQRTTLLSALNLADSLFHRRDCSVEFNSLLREALPHARALGPEDDTYLGLRALQAQAVTDDAAASLDDVAEAVTILEDISNISRRVMGPTHPLSKLRAHNLAIAQRKLARRRARASPA